MGTACSLVDGRLILLIIPYFIGGVLCERKQLNKTAKPCSPWWRPLPFQYMDFWYQNFLLLGHHENAASQISDYNLHHQEYISISCLSNMSSPSWKTHWTLRAHSSVSWSHFRKTLSRTTLPLSFFNCGTYLDRTDVRYWAISPERLVFKNSKPGKH